MQLLEWSAYDLFMRLLPMENKDSRIVIIGIKEDDIQRFGYPINDKQLTQLIQEIKSYQPRVIGLKYLSRFTNRSWSSRITRSI